MPRGDGTGPFGLGPGLGSGRESRRGFGRCRFWRCAGFCDYPMPYGTVSPVAEPYAAWRMSPEEKKNLLVDHMKMLEARLNMMKKRITELEKDEGKEK
ncbi:MAG: DUF5320 domain-containing protein [Candidatus Omnitrophica bacterium]|nr:DUF5320 domain-containing protein [Candidatus Omnitrophota bacterium]